MSNRRRRRDERGFEDWRARSLVSGLQLLALSGCGESSTEIDGVWVDVIVGCADPGCRQCGPGASAASPARRLAAGGRTAQLGPRGVDQGQHIEASVG